MNLLCERVRFCSLAPVLFACVLQNTHWAVINETIRTSNLHRSNEIIVVKRSGMIVWELKQWLAKGNGAAGRGKDRRKRGRGRGEYRLVSADTQGLFLA